MHGGPNFIDGTCSRILCCQAEFRSTATQAVEYEIAWTKCDMLATVCFARLDLFTLGRDYQGKRKYIKPKLSVVDFHRVKKGVLAALGMT